MPDTNGEEAGRVDRVRDGLRRWSALGEDSRPGYDLDGRQAEQRKLAERAEAT